MPARLPGPPDPRRPALSRRTGARHRCRSGGPCRSETAAPPVPAVLAPAATLLRVGPPRAFWISGGAPFASLPSSRSWSTTRLPPRSSACFRRPRKTQTTSSSIRPPLRARLSSPLPAPTCCRWCFCPPRLALRKARWCSTPPPAGGRIALWARARPTPFASTRCWASKSRSVPRCVRARVIRTLRSPRTRRFHFPSSIIQAASPSPLPLLTPLSPLAPSPPPAVLG